MGLRGEVFSSRASSANRTYFFNVKENRKGDLFLNIVESKKHGESGFERHQVVVFEEDFVEFASELQKAITFMTSNMRRRGDVRGSGVDRNDSRRSRVRLRRPTAKAAEWNVRPARGREETAHRPDEGQQPPEGDER